MFDFGTLFTRDMSVLIQRLKQKASDAREDYGKIGFWALYALAMPIIGLAVLTALFYELGPFLREHPLGPVWFTVGVTVLCGLAMLTTNVISVVAGWAFGFAYGMAAMMIAIAGAISINFYFSRKLAGPGFARVISQKPRIRAIHNALLSGNKRKVAAIVVLLRLSVSPFAGTNYMISASGVSFSVYFWSTMFGYIARTSAAVYVGTTIERLDFEQPTEAWMLVLSIAATIAAVIVISVLSKRALDRLTAAENQAL